jgi:hypothetical protein
MTQNEPVLNALYNAGYTPQRKINIARMVKVLTEEGYQVFDCVARFLAAYGGLIIRFENRKNGLQNDDINFDIEHAITIENSERILSDYAPRTEKNLCLIGTAYRDYFCLMMAEDGSVYGGYSDSLYKISDTITGFLDAVILDKEFIKIE